MRTPIGHTVIRRHQLGRDAIVGVKLFHDGDKLFDLNDDELNIGEILGRVRL